MTIPSYAELLQRDDAPPGSSWYLWGADNERGTLNFLTPESIRAAAGCVRTGERFRLDVAHPTVASDDPESGHRERRSPAVHHLFRTDPAILDDYVDNYYLQHLSQIDALRHVRNPRFGFYQGVPDAEIRAAQPHLGIQNFAVAPIVGRGVLLDVAAHFAGDPSYDPAGSSPITVEILEAVAAASRVEFRPGDILLLRTGALGEKLAGRLEGVRCPGLAQSHEVLAWLWDNRFSVLAADNQALEVVPPVADSPFVYEGHDSPTSGLMHLALIPLLGFVVGEWWDLDGFAAACAADGRYDALVVATPVHLVGGVGSPANAVAVR